MRIVDCLGKLITFQHLKQGTTPAFVDAVAFSAFSLKGVANHKVTLESKATAAVASIQPTGGQEFPGPMHNIRSRHLEPSVTPASVGGGQSQGGSIDPQAAMSCP